MSRNAIIRFFNAISPYNPNLITLERSQVFKAILNFDITRYDKNLLEEITNYAFFSDENSLTVDTTNYNNSTISFLHNIK